MISNGRWMLEVKSFIWENCCAWILGSILFPNNISIDSKCFLTSRLEHPTVGVDSTSPFDTKYNQKTMSLQESNDCCGTVIDL